MSRYEMDEDIVQWMDDIKSKERAKLKNLVFVQNPNYIHDKAPFVWKVFKGKQLVGAYRSRWEAEQCRDRIVYHGGDTIYDHLD